MTLVNTYFYYSHGFIPLLHEPTFRRDLASKRHIYDDDFAQLLLMMCSISSRFTKDPRVLLDGDTSFNSAGFRFAKQVTLFDPVCLRKPNLLQLQTYAVSVYDKMVALPYSDLRQFWVIYHNPVEPTHESWTLLGVAIRLAQDFGAHRRKVSEPLTVEAELWKRLWW